MQPLVYITGAGLKPPAGLHNFHSTILLPTVPPSHSQMTELVFYDQRLPLKRKWSASECGDHDQRPSVHHGTSSPPQRPLPRLPSLADWAPVRPNQTSLPPPLPSTLSILTPPPSMAAPTLASKPSAKKPASPPPTDTAKPTPMRNTSRERMKAEQAALRAQAATLENELTCLRQLRHERLSRTVSDRSAATQNTPEDFGWQEMAQRHWEQRVTSERENKRLREAVNGLATEVKSLESLFNSRSSALMASLRQNAQLAVQVQELLTQQVKNETHESPRALSKEKKHSPSQQSPRDVACTMEVPRFL